MKARLMTALALSVLAALAGADDPKDAVKAPDTPAGRLLAGWLGALGTGKPEALQRFITGVGPGRKSSIPTHLVGWQ